MNDWKIKIGVVCFFMFLVVFHGCTTGPAPQAGASTNTNEGERIASIARTLIGTPYRFGGDSVDGFDCSGLVRYVHTQIGIKVPRSSRMLYQQSKKIPLDKLQAGDLLFFKISDKKVSHVAIYLQNGHFIHAPSASKSVSTANLDSRYWSQRLIGAGRFW